MYAADPSVYTDIQGLAKLKVAAQQGSPAALDEAAQQFEALMLQMMLKSMREASQGEGLMDSDQSLFYRDMYDQQLAIHLANNGGLGLTDVIKRQLAGADGSGNEMASYRQQAVMAATVAFAPATQQVGTSAAEKIKPAIEPKIDSPETFLRQLWPMAKEAAAMLGQAPGTLLAQAALETGWGQKMIRAADGGTSYNLFGIKADSRWSGDRMMVPTLEFEQGVAVRQKASFRAYESFADSFRDYADFLVSSPRYQQVLQASDGPAYLASLQESGYATDPRYAEKIVAILERPDTQQILEHLKATDNKPK
ncbi:Flagellar protein FlgJ [peptidoglycan hydrolase] [hydrothermal vent metagenome]|uniref:Peptidoglycan hydrolase FlgJ n=1 Tax=hydrothermal vent metagenome TaxID=652676 RepID=A0A3B1ASD5_9ZZZZ